MKTNFLQNKFTKIFLKIIVKILFIIPFILILWIIIKYFLETVLEQYKIIECTTGHCYETNFITFIFINSFPFFFALFFLLLQIKKTYKNILQKLWILIIILYLISLQQWIFSPYYNSTYIFDVSNLTNYKTWVKIEDSDWKYFSKIFDKETNDSLIFVRPKKSGLNNFKITDEYTGNWTILYSSQSDENNEIIELSKNTEKNKNTKFFPFFSRKIIQTFTYKITINQ